MFILIAVDCYKPDTHDTQSNHYENKIKRCTQRHQKDGTLKSVHVAHRKTKKKIKKKETRMRNKENNQINN